MKLDSFMSKLEGIKRSGEGYSARCPAHDDKRNSLSVCERSGKILLNCHAHDCSAEAICMVLGLRVRDLFTESETKSERKQISSKAWEIRDTGGKLIAEHIRHDFDDGSKSFSWHRNGKLGLDGFKLENMPLYGSEILSGFKPDESIVITEGEKSCDAAGKLGLQALGTVTGAASCPSLEVLKTLADRPNKVELWPDNDDAGRAHMAKIAQRLHQLGKEPAIIFWPDAPEKGDAADFHGDVAQLPRKNVSYICKYTNRTPSSTHERDKSGTRNGTDSLKNQPGELSRFQALAGRVEAWVKETTGWFATDELDKDLNIVGKAKDNRRKIMLRLKDQGIVEPHPRVNKQWRFINTKTTSLNFKTATTEGILRLSWPLEIEKLVNIYPGNIALVAGAPNAGKTALLLNVIYLNQNNFPISYFCSEMGAVELRSRLDLFPGMTVNDWHFDATERASDFADVIRPDCLNIIDYLEMTEELYLVNTHLTAISHKLGTGVAIVALQKKEGQRMGRGQEFGLEKPKVYLSLDRGKLTIVKGKSWALKNVDPAGLQRTFKIVGGCQFEATSKWECSK